MNSFHGSFHHEVFSFIYIYYTFKQNMVSRNHETNSFHGKHYHETNWFHGTDYHEAIEFHGMVVVLWVVVVGGGWW